MFLALVALGLILFPGAAVAKEMDLEALALGERFRKIVTYKDLPALKKLMQPSYDACATAKNRKINDAYISRLFAADMKAGFKSVSLEPIKPNAVKFLLTPGAGTTYPVMATHTLHMRVKDPPRKPGAAIIKRGESNEQYFVKKKRKWFLTYPCPTLEKFVKIANEFKMEKKARAFVAALDPALVKKIKRTLDEKSLKETMKLNMDTTGQDENLAHWVIQIFYVQ